MDKPTRDKLGEALGKAMCSYKTLSSIERYRLDEEIRRLQAQLNDERTGESLHVMAEHGWYIDPSWISGAETGIADMFHKHPAEEVDAQLCFVVDAQLEDSLKALVRQYERVRIFV